MASILIVDDDPDLRSLLTLILKLEGYEVFEAKNAHQALEMIETSVPDLFLIDIMMPVMTGFELTRRLRAHESTAQHPILLLSARTDRESIAEGMSCGANHYLTKPVPPETLITHIQQHIGSAAVP